jgi:hypothetical protein
MALYFLQNLGAKTVKGTNQVIVAAESADDARVIAAASFNSDSSWAAATVTALVDTVTWDAAASAKDWTFKINVQGGAAQTVDPIEAVVVGDADDDLDDVLGKLATALNAATDIANAAYAAPNLTVAAIADGIGDAKVRLSVYGPGDTSVDVSALLLAAGGITDEGIAGADLVIAFVADTEIKPAIVAQAVQF